MTDAEQKPLRAIRSYVKREGKLTKGQHNAIHELWPIYGLDLCDNVVDLAELFSRSATNIVEIGFGNGLSLAQMAEAHPQDNFLGIEVHTPGVGSLLVQVKKQALSNIRVSGSDAVLVFEQQIPDNSIDRVQIFFPDPWHKKRHHKRRLIQPAFVDKLVAKLKIGGVLHVATDWQNYAEHILEVLNNNVQLNNTADQYAAKPIYRPNTKYEERGLKLGHGVWDLVFEKT